MTAREQRRAEREQRRAERRMERERQEPNARQERWNTSGAAAADRRAGAAGTRPELAFEREEPRPNLFEGLFGRPDRRERAGVSSRARAAVRRAGIARQLGSRAALASILRGSPLRGDPRMTRRLRDVLLRRPVVGWRFLGEASRLRLRPEPTHLVSRFQRALDMFVVRFAFEEDQHVAARTLAGVAAADSSCAIPKTGIAPEAANLN